MPPSLQIKLLRVLQEREVIPVGATEPIPVDVRIVAATNRDLEEEIRRGSFRSDLFYRLNVIALDLPRCATGGTTFSSSSRRSCRGWPPTPAARPRPFRRKRSTP